MGKKLRDLYDKEHGYLIESGIGFREKTLTIPEKGIYELRRANKEIVGAIGDSRSVEDARKRLSKYLSKKETDIENERLTPLEIVNTQRCMNVFKNILSKRNEERTEHSSLSYLYQLISDKEGKDISKGFIEEFYYLFRGIRGKHKAMRYAKDFEERSGELDELSKVVNKYVKKYRSGLDKRVIEHREKNKKRILDYFDADENKWKNWRWHLRHVIKDSDTLSDLIELTEEDVEAIDMANEHFIPFGITPYYVSLMDKKPGKDRAIRRQVIPPNEYVEIMKEHKKDRSVFDFMKEQSTSPVAHVTRRYPEIAILKPYDSCPQICVYCQRNWEVKDVLSKDARVPDKELKKAISWFKNTPSMKEVLITGGDPLVLGNKRLDNIISEFNKMNHIKRIRIGTRTPVTVPSRINDGFVEMIKRYHKPGKQDVCIATHFEHPYEVTPESRDAIEKIRETGVSVKNQQVYTLYNSRRFETVALRKVLTQIGVEPYYLFNAKGKAETNRYRVPIPRILQERKEEARLIPGIERTDKPVFNVPKIGKTNLRGSQDHQVVMITPGGSRVYEFLPWDSSETYLYEDVSISEYLRRLERIGENPKDYESIWYYY